MLCTNELGLTLSLVLAVSAGCAGLEESQLDDAADDPSVDVAQEGVITVSDLDCSFCNVARECCQAVNPNPEHCLNFDAARCEALDPGRMETTIRNCLVNVNITISAWRLAGREPPPACHVP